MRHFLGSCFSICTILAVLATHIAAVNASERDYPFPRTRPISVGNENFQPEYRSLQGLEGVHLNLKNVESSLLQSKSEMTDEYRESLEKIITEAGLLLIPKDDVRWSPGQPILEIWPTLGEDSASVQNGICSYDHTVQLKAAKSKILESDNRLDSDVVKPVFTPEELAKIEQVCATLPPRCNTTLWVSFSQSASLLRQPLREYRLSTWGSGASHTACENKVEWLSETVAEKLQDFVDDYRKAQQEQMPVIVSRADQLPRNCAQSWMMVEGVFEVNETLITPKAEQILKRFVESTADCNGFGYVVEAHDDNHADNQYNQILRTARSETVKELMNADGIHFKRIKLRAKNEEVAFMSGTLEPALLTGSVIIYPQSPVEFSNLELDF